MYSSYVNDVKVNLGEIECEGLAWSGLAQERDKRVVPANSVMDFLVP
jgi:hypothetical protein